MMRGTPPHPVAFQGDLHNLPEALAPLKAYPNWVCWKFVWKVDKKGIGNWTKPPYRPDKPQSYAKNNDPKTWGTYEQALTAFEAGKCDGIGFCLLGTDIAAFDIDKCRDPATGDIAPEAMEIVNRAESYTEMTPSGTGLRVLGRGSGSKVHRKQKLHGCDVEIESYRDAERYITITGNPLPSTWPHMVDISAVVDAVVAELESGEQDKDELSNLIENGVSPKDDLSAAFHGVVCKLGERGWTADQIEARITGKPIVPERFAKRLRKEINRCLQKASAQHDPDVARLNKDYALVIVGDKTIVLVEGKEISFLRVEAFGQWLANQNVYHNGKWIPLAKYWMGHPQRRQYKGIVFDPSCDEVPGYFNLWRGFTVEPKPGDCSKFLAHLRDNVCRGDVALYNWVVGWFADIVQHPHKKSGTSLVLRGGMGVGKTKVGEVFGSLFHAHYALVDEPRYITGRFNAHLVSCILLHCDEAFWAGDKAAEGKLKGLVTGDHQFIEFKGKEAIRVRSYVRLLICGNKDWLVPATFDERRFGILDVGEDHKQDKPYFAAIDKEMDNGGREALLHYLLNFDLSQVDVRTIPKTAALLDQQLSSLDDEHGWWLDVLSRGELPWGCESYRECATSKLCDNYIKHAQRHGARRKSSETRLGMFLNKIVPGLQRNVHGQYDICEADGGIRKVMGSTYTFPPLADCRAAFASTMQQQFMWDEKKEWTHDPGTGRVSPI